MEKQLDAGSLLVVGGHEDRTGAMDVLRRFVELAGGKDKPLAVVTAASEVPDKVWAQYKEAFAELDATHVKHIRTTDRAHADDASTAAALAAARGIFISGGAQKRLMQILGGSQAERAMRDAYERGACIAGTSAGASALCSMMLMKGDADLEPAADAIEIGHGLGFLSGVIVDQHFSERHRINRLLTVTAEHPSLLGLGMDENTALVVQRGVGIEVVGAGAASVVDCRAAHTNINQIPKGMNPVLLGVRLHVLPAGTAYELPTPAARSSLSDHAEAPPPDILDFVNKLTYWNQPA